MCIRDRPELDYSMDTDTDVDNNYGTDIETMRHTSQYKKRKERRNLNLTIQWEKQCLGIFDLKPAYPGRSAHVVTGTFLVNAGIRGKGIGKTLVETFIAVSYTHLDVYKRQVYNYHSATMVCRIASGGLRNRNEFCLLPARVE